MKRKKKVKTRRSIGHRCIHCGFFWYSPDPPGEYICGACDELLKANTDELNADHIKIWAGRRNWDRDEDPCSYADDLIDGLCLALEARLHGLMRLPTDEQLAKMVAEAAKGS